MNKSIVVKLDPKKVAANVGLLPGGRIHRVFMDTVAKRMEGYLPFRNYGSMPDKMMQGKNYEKSHFHFSGPHSSFLYDGVVKRGPNAGAPLNYTKSPHPQAGPHWDRQVQQNEIEVIAKTVQEEIDKAK